MSTSMTTGMRVPAARAAAASGGELRDVVDDDGGARVAIGVGERGDVGRLHRRIGEQQIARDAAACASA